MIVMRGFIPLLAFTIGATGVQQPIGAPQDPPAVPTSPTPSPATPIDLLTFGTTENRMTVPVSIGPVPRVHQLRGGVVARQFHLRRVDGKGLHVGRLRERCFLGERRCDEQDDGNKGTNAGHGRRPRGGAGWREG